MMRRDLKPMRPDLSEKLWHLVTVAIAREAEEFASSILFEQGASGIVTLEENSDTIKLGAYFEAHPEEVARAIEAGLARAGQFNALKAISISAIPDQDWMQKWKEGFEPVNIGDRLIIAPSWKRPEASAGRAVIQIDPGMAFGTGTHETTRLCLEAIEAHWRGGSLLDVGTGTGILAIAAAKLAPGSRIIAIDIDPLAVEVARENVAINGVSDSITVSEGQPRDFTGRAFDMVVANLTAEVIIALMDDLAQCLAPAGKMILSGILVTLAAGVEQALRTAGLTVSERRDAGEWAAFVAEKGNA
ncbi:MAG TPA: 50S ribosomal protein L11 methyltransferase [Blastocatellia bacterium]|nr:50S ribosomal protein L11 methyltransferase [Blastocatellia bacterium]